MRLWPFRRDERSSELGGPPPPLELRLDRDRIGPGELVRGDVIAAREVPGRVDVAVRLHERSLACDVVAVEVAAVASRRGELADRVAYAFAIELPADALPSCPSPHGGLLWSVEASASELDDGVAVRGELVVTTARALAAAEQPA